MPYMVMVRCPTEDEAVSTGVACDVAAFDGLAAHQTLLCPACGQSHVWSPEDAWLRDRAYAIGQLRFDLEPTR
jgi:hypothetical protein